MRLVTYVSPVGPQAGFLVGDRICPLAAAASAAGVPLKVTSVRELLSTVESSQRQLMAAAASALVEHFADTFPGIGRVALLPPVPDPLKIICLALNSRSHCAEAGVPEPPVPWFFPKWQTSLAGHGATVRPPRVTGKLDWEGEVALVIGRPARNVPEEQALSYVAGVMPFNDLSARDLLYGIETLALTKSGDGQAPCGPALVSLDEIDDLNDLHYRTRVNGVIKQDGSTSDQVFTAAQTIASLTRTTTLLPGDIIAMGTLVGVGLFRSPPEFLHEGDVVEVEVDGVGLLRNTIGAPADAAVYGPATGIPAPACRT